MMEATGAGIEFVRARISAQIVGQAPGLRPGLRGAPGPAFSPETAGRRTIYAGFHVSRKPSGTVC